MSLADTDLYVFSGTGNTLLVARELCAALQDAGGAARLRWMERTPPAQVDLSHTLGLAFPVACQSTYPLVWDWVRGLPRATGTPVFMVDTMAAYSGAIVGPLRGLLERRGYRPVGAREIRMPNNLYRKRVGTEQDAAIVARGQVAARRYAGDLLSGRARWGAVPVLPDLFRIAAAGPWTWWAVDRHARLMRVAEDRCSRCGLCARLCPVGAIHRRGGLPAVGPGCVACLRCTSFCPTGALRWAGPPMAPYRAVSAADLLQQS